MSDTARETGERARQWLDTWEKAGAALDDERARQLRDLGADDARVLTRDLLALWSPAEEDNLGGALVTQQRWFSIAARASRIR